MRTSGFRDDIQGVRAIAVLAVVAYHAGVGPFPGGFVGLDVFFVVSGFLITSLLLREQQRTGRVSLVRFYASRARRILPAATFVSLVTVAGAWYFLNLIDAREAAYDALWASLFVANVRFADEETDYFALDSAPSPLQHYWSLSVEEQFYVVLPLLILGCLAWAARGRRGAQPSRGPGSPTRAIATAVGVLTLASFAWSLYATAQSPQTAYFSTFTRIWELGVGALLAIGTPHFAGMLTTRARNLLGALGLAAVALAAVRYTGTTAFPGYAALLPVLGTAALMVAGAEQRSGPAAVQRLLGTAPMRAIGDASYSIYLWHWPLYVILTGHLGRGLGPGETALMLVALAALSWASFRWVETPFRRAAPRPIGRALVLYPVSVAVVLAGCLASATWVDQHRGPDVPAIATSEFSQAPDGDELAVDPTIALVEASAEAAREDAPIPTDLTPALLDLREDKADLGDCDYGGPPFTLCPRGADDAERTLVVLGDSHGRHWIPALERIADRAGWTAYYLVKPACTPAHVVTVEQGTDEAWEDCAAFNTWAQEQVGELRPDLLVISTSAPAHLVVDGSATSDEDTVVAQMRGGFDALLADLGAPPPGPCCSGTPPGCRSSPPSASAPATPPSAAARGPRPGAPSGSWRPVGRRPPRRAWSSSTPPRGCAPSTCAQQWWAPRSRCATAAT
nr:acyltransferase family protein [Nocardioides pantholopis]